MVCHVQNKTKKVLVISLPPLSLFTVESCSMDTLRNATKAMIDMGCITYRKGSFIHVADSAKLMDVVEGIMKFKK